MIIGQILINGTAYSCHRYSEMRFTVPRVKQLLAELTAMEDLHELGKVDILVHSQRGLERLMAAIWGRGGSSAQKSEAPAPREKDPLTGA